MPRLSRERLDDECSKILEGRGTHKGRLRMATDNLRQRRGKKGGTGGVSTPADGATSSAEEVTPIQQLRNAHARLVLSRERTAELHHSWRNQVGAGWTSNC